MSGASARDDFDRHRWHDDEIHAFELRVGDPERDDWTSDLVLDIDHIVEWVPGDAGMRFRVAPATLVFRGATDLRIEIDAARGGHATSLVLPSISHVDRERIVEQKVFLDRPYYRWRMVLNGMPDGEISFGAVGFAETLRSQPLLVDQPRLHRSQRSSADPAW